MGSTMEYLMRRTLAAAALALALLAAAGCGSGEEGGGVTGGVTPGITPNEGGSSASLTPVGFPLDVEVQAFLGETIAFSYPKDWYVWSNSYELERETVVLGNVPSDEAAEELPEGAIRIEFIGAPAESPQAIEGEIVETLDVAGVKFSLREGEDVPWLLTGGFKIGGIDFRYFAKALMNTADPETGQLLPILESWVVGSTNHHPARTCISPVKCP